MTARPRSSTQAQGHKDCGPHIHRRMNVKGQRRCRAREREQKPPPPDSSRTWKTPRKLRRPGKDPKERKRRRIDHHGPRFGRKPTTTPLVHAERNAQQIDDEPSRGRLGETCIGHRRKRKSAREGGEQRVNAAPAMLAARAARACVSIRDLNGDN